MSFFRLGSLAALLSEPLVNGFTTASAVHVTVSQLKDLFGIQIPRHKGAFKIIYVSPNFLFENLKPAFFILSVLFDLIQTVFDCIPQISNSNPKTVIMSLCVIMFMVFMNEILKVSRYYNKFFTRKS